MTGLSETDKAALGKVTNEYELAAHILTKANQLYNDRHPKPNPHNAFECQLVDNEIKPKIESYLKELSKHKIGIDNQVSQNVIKTLQQDSNLSKLTVLARKVDEKSLKEIQQQGPTFKERIADLFKGIFKEWAKDVQQEKMSKVERMATTGLAKPQPKRSLEQQKADKEYIEGAKQRFKEAPKTIENHRNGSPALDTGTRKILERMVSTQTEKVANLVGNCEVTQQAIKDFKKSGVTPAKNAHVKKPVVNPTKDVSPQGRGSRS